MDNKNNNAAEENADTVTLNLEDGTVLECDVLAIFPAGDNQYIALLPQEPYEDYEEGEVFLYRFKELPDNEIQLDSIESDEEYEIVADAFDEILDEEEFNEADDSTDEE